MFSIAVTVTDPANGVNQDVVVRAGPTQTVGELARRLAQNPGKGHTLQVRRTGENLAPDSRLGDVDLIEGDILTVIPWLGPRRGFNQDQDQDAV